MSDAVRDLKALRICAPVIFGRASPIARTIAGSGQGECAPAERVEELLPAAHRALRKLAGMRASNNRYAAALIATHVFECSVTLLWPLELALMLRDSAVRKSALKSLAGVRTGAGPDTASLTAEGLFCIAEAERLYEEADERASTGHWWANDCDAVTRALHELGEQRSQVTREIATAKAGPRPTPTPAPEPRKPTLCGKFVSAKYPDAWGKCALTEDHPGACESRKSCGYSVEDRQELEAAWDELDRVEVKP